jgi:hypothetical protein
MDQIKTLNSVETSFSISTASEQVTQFTHEYLFRGSKGSGMTKSVNNYLKTVEEIEAECCFACFSDKGFLSTELKKDGYSNIHSLDDIVSGTMEENY